MRILSLWQPFSASPRTSIGPLPSPSRPRAPRGQERRGGAPGPGQAPRSRVRAAWSTIAGAHPRGQAEWCWPHCAPC